MGREGGKCRGDEEKKGNGKGWIEEGGGREGREGGREGRM